jgi:hypothetical protein
MDDEQHTERFRQRLAGRFSEEAIDAGMALSDKIAADSRPDHDLGSRLTRVMVPFLSGDEDLYTMQMLSAFATNAWNVTLMPLEEEQPFIDFCAG